MSEYKAKDRSLVFLINSCDELMYVSVIEFAEHLPERTCAVFGLQSPGDGKAYRRNEWYVEESLAISRSPGRALRQCQRSGYETVGGGQGIFIKISDADAYIGKRAPKVDGGGETESDDPGKLLVQYNCDDCDQQLLTLMNGLTLTGEQSASFVPLIEATVAKIESMIRRRRLRQNQRNLAFVVRSDQRQIWEQAEPDFRRILSTEQWDAFLVLRTYVDAQFGPVRGGIGGEDYVFDLDGSHGTDGAAASISVN